MIQLSRPQIGANEFEAVRLVLESGQLAQGPMVENFEDKFAELVGTRYAVAVSSGTAALYLALLGCGITEGEVITTPFTFAATINAIRWAGAKPVCVDVDPDTLNIDASLIEQAITSRTRAIMPVHLYGHICDMVEINSIASPYGLYIIEDACQAVGARLGSISAGAFGEVGCFSFYATKNLTTGEGGMITTDNLSVANECRLLRNHGMKRRYSYEMVGYNFRMTEMQAALGLAQLARFNEMQIKRAANAQFYYDNLIGVELPEVKPGHVHAWHQFTIKSEKRYAIAQALKEKGIETGIFYPNLAMAGYYPVANRATELVLSLPVHPGLSLDDLEKITGEINKCVS